MIPKYRTIRTDEKARKHIKQGVDFIGDVVQRTLGPFGDSVLIEGKDRIGARSRGIPAATNDGFHIALEMIPENKHERIGAQVLVDVAKMQNQVVGDGTTTAMVLTQAIIHQVYKELGSDVIIGGKTQNCRELKRKIDTACKEVVEQLEKQSKELTTKEQLVKVAQIAVEDEELGQIMADMMFAIGKDGFIWAEDTYKYKTETEVIPGMKFLGTYSEEYFITDPHKKRVVWKSKEGQRDVSILLTNHDIEGSKAEIAKMFMPLRAEMEQNGFNTLIIITTGKISGEASILFHINNITDKIPEDKKFKVLPLKARTLTTEEMEDVACYLDAKLINKDKGEKIEEAQYENLGKAEKVIADMDDIILIGGKGKEKEVKKRIKELKSQREEEQDDMFKKKITKRMAALAGGVGIIKVGARTETEKYYLKDKIDDGVFALKAAMEEGVVQGGGLALKKIADKLPKDNILKKALCVPYQQIIDNSGGQLKESDLKDGLDPTKVVRLAVENACSGAGTALIAPITMAWQSYGREDMRNIALQLAELLQQDE